MLDEEGRELPQGEGGEIYVRVGAYPDFTYHNSPQKRARRSSATASITVGDVGYFDATAILFLCDRKRDMVISGGVNIYPAEIEAAMLRAARRGRLRRLRHPGRGIRREHHGRDSSRRRVPCCGPSK